MQRQSTCPAFVWPQQKDNEKRIGRMRLLYNASVGQVTTGYNAFSVVSLRLQERTCSSPYLLSALFCMISYFTGWGKEIRQILLLSVSISSINHNTGFSLEINGSNGSWVNTAVFWPNGRTFITNFPLRKKWKTQTCTRYFFGREQTIIQLSNCNSNPPIYLITDTALSPLHALSPDRRTAVMMNGCNVLYA